MGRQKGVLKVEGTLGGLTFYESQDGSMVREKGGVSGDRIAKDPAFARTRENGEEFASAGTGGKVVRDTLRSLMMNAADGRVTARLTKVMSDLLKLDAVNVRGKRVPAEGLKTDAGRALLKGFNFNVKAVVGSILFKKYIFDPVAGSVDFGALSTLNDIVCPPGATHVKIGFAIAHIDLATGKGEVDSSISEDLEIKAQVLNFTLKSPKPTMQEGTRIYLIKIEFSQKMNNQFYGLKNGAYNALAVIEVEAPTAQASPTAKAPKGV